MLSGNKQYVLWLSRNRRHVQDGSGKEGIDESLAQAVTKSSVGNLQQATGIMNAGWDVCWEDVAAKKELSRAFKLALEGRERFG